MPSLGVAIAITAAGAATGLLFGASMEKVGTLGVLAPAAVAFGLILLRFPAAALGLLLISTVLIEPESGGILPPVSSFYDVAAVSLTLQDMLLMAGLGGVLLSFAIEGERPRLPDPFSAPLALLAMAVAGGVVTGYSTGAVPNGELFHRSMTAFYVVLVPVLAVNALRDTRSLRIFALIVAGLGAFKGVAGVYAAVGGTGTAFGDEALSYLSPVPNLVMLAFVLGVTAALVRRIRIPPWIIVAAPLSLIALVLSYRRSFWIAAAVTLFLVVIIASRRRGRAVVALGAIGLAIAVGATMLVGSSGPLTSPLVERAQTLSPTGLGTNRGDRYRMDERRNVLENIRRHPLTGNGLGVPWSTHYPLAEAHDRRYAHVAVLWLWLAFGPLGVIAYLAIMGTALWTAVRVWRRHPDPVVQISAIACFGTVVALLIVELTASFTTIEPRMSLIVGGILGWLAAAWHDIPKPEGAPAIRGG